MAVIVTIVVGAVKLPAIVGIGGAIPGERHEYKLAALEKTIAFPVAPRLFLSDLRVLLALALLALVGVVDAVWRR